MIDFSEVLEAFRIAAAERNIALPASLEYGKLTRCGRIDAPRKKDCSYIIHLDERPAGGFENCADGLGWQKWSFGKSVALDKAALESHLRKVAAKVSARQREAEVAADSAAEKCRALFEGAAKDCGRHAYLTRKGVKAFGLRLEGNRLLVPLRDTAGQIRNLQYIFEDKLESGTDKLFEKNAIKAGLYHSIGKPHADNIICICEGYATGASIHQATSWPVIIALDCNNLESVTAAMRAKYPDARLMICADDDYKQKLKNPGRLKGEAAAGAYNGICVFPVWPANDERRGSDFNDLAATLGLDEVTRQLKAAMAPAVAPVELAPVDSLAGLPDAEGGPWAPEPYKIGASIGVIKIIMREGQPHQIQVSPTPVWLSGVRLDAVDNQHHLVINWLRRGQRCQMTVERGVALVARNITNLLGAGFPCDSNAAAAMVDYLRRAETVYLENTTRTDAEFVASVTGWHGADDWRAPAFLSGRQRFGDNCPNFEHRDSNLNNFISRFAPQGEMKVYLSAVQETINDNPDLATIFAAALASPLLRLVGASPFVLDLAAATSQGKTKALKFAAAVWASPDLTLSWDSTKTGLERHINAARGLTICIDESQRAKSAEAVQQTIYDLTTNVGKLRGATNGATQATAKFESIIISSGEQPLSDFGGAGGARARVMTIWASPWGRGNAEARISNSIATFQRRILDALADNHGMAGPTFAAHLASLTDEGRRDLRARFRQLTASRASQADAISPRHPIAGRLAEYAALIDLAGEVSASIFGLQATEGWLTESRWRDILARTRPADIATTALERLVSWALSRSAALNGHADNNGTVAREIIGIWQQAADSKHRLSIVIMHGADMLKAAGYQVNSIAAQWADKGWLEGSAGSKTSKVVRLNGAQMRVWQLTDKALASFVWYDDAAADKPAAADLDEDMF